MTISARNQAADPCLGLGVTGGIIETMGGLSKKPIWKTNSTAPCNCTKTHFEREAAGDRAGAEASCREALALMEEIDGPSHPNVANLMQTWTDADRVR
jgi:hypothetical protein